MIAFIIFAFAGWPGLVHIYSSVVLTDLFPRLAAPMLTRMTFRTTTCSLRGWLGAAPLDRGPA